jgi:hypothetical protein
MQLERLIDKLSIYISEEKEGLVLNRSGHEVLLGQHNAALAIASHMTFGGVNKYDFQFSKPLNKLVKKAINAH